MGSQAGGAPLQGGQEAPGACPGLPGSDFQTPTPWLRLGEGEIPHPSNRREEEKGEKKGEEEGEKGKEAAVPGEQSSTELSQEWLETDTK